VALASKCALQVIKAEGWELQPAVYGISKQLQVGRGVRGRACGAHHTHAHH